MFALHGIYFLVELTIDVPFPIAHCVKYKKLCAKSEANLDPNIWFRCSEDETLVSRVTSCPQDACTGPYIEQSKDVIF